MSITAIYAIANVTGWQYRLASSSSQTIAKVQRNTYIMHNVRSESSCSGVLHILAMIHLQDWLLSAEGHEWAPNEAAAEAATPGAGVALLKIASAADCASMTRKSQLMDDPDKG